MISHFPARSSHCTNAADVCVGSECRARRGACAAARSEIIERVFFGGGE